MHDYPIHIGADALQQLQAAISASAYSQYFVLADTHTYRDCYPLVQPFLPDHRVKVIQPGEIFKNLDTCTEIWQAMTEAKMDRKALVLNLGGGVIGDMGGFAAGTYKRGVDFIQVPTTLLSQVDASVGGKLGIDFQGYKNHIGLFREPSGVYIYPAFLQTLPFNELRSGFAEVIKHHLIADAGAWETLSAHAGDLTTFDFEALIRHSVAVKQRIVEQDPQEKGARKALNFGHTLGHAIESFFLKQRPEAPLLHGEAIAIGMIAEAYLSHLLGFLSLLELNAITALIKRYYPHTDIPENSFEEIYQHCLQDKKNQTGTILCTLLRGVGAFRINQPLNRELVVRGLLYYNSLG